MRIGLHLMRRARRGKAAGGQVIIVFALTFGLFLSALLAMVADVATILHASADSYRAAQAGALQGATAFDVGCFLTGTSSSPGQPCARAKTVQLRLDAKAMCETAGDRVGGSSTTTCGVDPTDPRKIVATSRLTPRIPLWMPGVQQPTVSALYTAFAQLGTDVPK